jgi:hypothetical protein
MRIQLPRATRQASSISLVLDDGRCVEVSGDGGIFVTGEGPLLGGSNYSLVLPSFEDVITQCDARDDPYAPGHMTIQVEHRH